MLLLLLMFFVAAVVVVVGNQIVNNGGRARSTSQMAILLEQVSHNRDISICFPFLDNALKAALVILICGLLSGYSLIHRGKNGSK
jgi:hypothetical protein